MVQISEQTVGNTAVALAPSTTFVDTYFDYDSRSEHFNAEMEKRGIYVSPTSQINLEKQYPSYHNNEVHFTFPVGLDKKDIAIVLYDSPTDFEPYAVIKLDECDKYLMDGQILCSKKLVGPGAKPGLHYHLSIDGVLALDQKALGVSGSFEWIKPEEFNYGKGPNTDRDSLFLNELFDRAKYDAQPFHIPKATVVEMPPFVPESEHVRVALGDKFITEFMPQGTTKDKSIPLEDRGKAAAVTAPAYMKHLKDMGVTTIKFPPLHYSIDEGLLKTDYYKAGRIREKHWIMDKDPSLSKEDQIKADQAKFDVYWNKLQNRTDQTHAWVKELTPWEQRMHAKLSEFREDDGHFGKEWEGTNAWGYNTALFTALNPKFFKSQDPAGMIEELRQIVKTLHENGFEVMFDLVVAHNCEYTPGQGPAFGPRVLGDDLYMRKDKQGNYVNASACGNSINTNTAASQDLIEFSMQFYRNIIGGDCVRFDQPNILMRDEEHVFNTNHSIMKKALMIFGHHQVFCETSDECNFEDFTKTRNALHYGDYPEGVVEIRFRQKDTFYDAYMQKAWIPYVRGVRFAAADIDPNAEPHAKTNLKYKSTKSILAYDVSGSSDISPNGGHLNMLTCHDGKRDIDMAIEVYEHLRKNEVIMKASKAECIHGINRAMIGSAFLSPGPIKTSYGFEYFRTQKKNPNSWDRPEQLTTDVDSMIPAKQRLYGYIKNLAWLRKERADFFKRTSLFTEQEMDWAEWNGEKTQDIDWEKNPEFIGQLYFKNGKEFSDGSLYITRAFLPGTLKLPVPPFGMQWVRRLDSQFADPAEQIKEAELFSEYHFAIPADAVFELRKMPSQAAQAA